MLGPKPDLPDRLLRACTQPTCVIILTCTHTFHKQYLLYLVYLDYSVMELEVRMTRLATRDYRRKAEQHYTSTNFYKTVHGTHDGPFIYPPISSIISTTTIIYTFIHFLTNIWYAAPIHASTHRTVRSMFFSVSVDSKAVRPPSHK